MEFKDWDLSLEGLFQLLKSRRQGLSQAEAAARQKMWGPNTLKPASKGKGFRLLISQFNSPLIFLLIFAASLSLFFGAHTDATIILLIVLASGGLGYYQERGAVSALEKIMQIVSNKVEVWRDEKIVQTFAEELVPGDVIELKAGDQVPADCVLIESNHLFVNEATLSGESFPVEKKAENADPSVPLLKRPNALFMMTTIVSGYALAIVVATAKETKYGAMADHIRFRPPETAFETGVKKFSYFLLDVTMVLMVAIFAFNLYFHRPILDSFLFSVALAVGLTPQLLPAIISVNLSHGARRMAKQKVVVKRLPSIENFGQMDILCADKTGTLTIGAPHLSKTFDWMGEENKKIPIYAALNASFQKGYENPLDTEIIKTFAVEPGWRKLDEKPYDFTHKRLIVLLQKNHENMAIAKGAIPSILSICTKIEKKDGSFIPLSEGKEQIEKIFSQESADGHRLLGIAYSKQSRINEEKDYVFLGFLRFEDPMKPDIEKVVASLNNRGVRLKIITGDNQWAAMKAASFIGLTHAHLTTGTELAQMSDEALMHHVEEKNIFAEIEPNQKERIILALRRMGHIVGFLGDGMNDVSALHGADVGIAVEGGVAAAKEAADIVLLEKDLTVLRTGIEEGRHTFTNTIKYVYMAASANFGNMFSMAGASLFLPFLPLLPKQVLLTNLLTDFPEMAIASDHVDAEMVRKPLSWNLPFIRKFMIVFGLISSIFDYLTFGVLLLWLHASMDQFRTGWFVESVLSATIIVLAIRTRRWIFQSKPGKWLLIAIVLIVASVLILPYSKLGGLFGFQALSLDYYGIIAGIVALYVVSVEIAKRFFRSHKNISTN